MSLQFFPKLVYRCECLAEVVASCLHNQTLSFKDICDEANTIDGVKIYSTKCGENDSDVVLSCINHMPMNIFVVQLSENNIQLLETNNACLMCIRKYLREMYSIFQYEVFSD